MTDANINNFISGDFLFELGAEELPSGQIKNIADYFSSKLKELLQFYEISFGNIKQFYTPRRIVILIQDLPAEVPNRIEIIKGPPATIAKDSEGKLTQAALGFLKKNNHHEEDSYMEDGYLCIKKIIIGNNTKDTLKYLLPIILKETPGVRFMRWANSEAKFARPPQWICALHGNNIIDFQFENITASNKSYGHRFLGPEEFIVKDFDQYVMQLEEQGVTLDQDLRKQKIVREANELAKSIGAETIYDDALLDEISLITENPSPVLCDFDSRFLEIPECVLTTVMIQHQRYIPLKRDGKLIEQFIAISNNHLEKARHNIKVGNEKVIVPRFKDAEFFVHEDNKISLNERFVKLDRLNFLKGSMQQKAKRLEKISEYIAIELEKTLSGNPVLESKLELVDIKRAALLAKADLSTNLVFEFTELQGEIGGIYAAKQGLSKNIQESISEHYLPRFAGDKHPKNIGGKIISIADKVDNIVCSFALGKIPSGSADPFALRRQANGLLEIIIESRLIMDIEKLIKFTCELQERDFGNGDIVTKIKGRGEDRQEVQVSELTWQGTDKAVIDFIESRLEFVFEQRHKNKDINKSVLSLGNALKELNKRHMTIHFLASISAQSQFEKLVEGVNRLINICKGKEISQEIKPELFETDYEKEFYEVSKKLNSCKDQNLNYDTVYNPELLFSAADAISKFFDNVLVNSDEEKLRLNRQALVAYANNTFKNLADFSLIK